MSNHAEFRGASAVRACVVNGRLLGQDSGVHGLAGRRAAVFSRGDGVLVLVRAAISPVSAEVDVVLGASLAELRGQLQGRRDRTCRHPALDSCDDEAIRAASRALAAEERAAAAVLEEAGE